MATANVGVFLRRLTRGMVAETVSNLSDRQLVEQFLARQEEAVFEAIVRRHGAMVYRVCWRVLQHHQDAEDAFQATFLLLAQRLRTVRKHASLASWLHGVAHRVALKAKAEAATRRRHEQQASVSQAMPPDDVSWGEVRAVLDAELAGLPEKWRLPLVLCYLEGRTQDEAAEQLGWSKRTLRRRLEEGRTGLGRRLRRGGVVWPAGLSAVLLSDCVASAALSPGLLDSTIKAATVLAAGQTPAGLVSAKVAALTEGVLKAMFLTKLKIATAVLLGLAVLAAGTATLARVAGAREPKPTANPPKEPLFLVPFVDSGTVNPKQAPPKTEVVGLGVNSDGGLNGSVVAQPAVAVDLTKIDRTITKEPAYKNKPKYCLLALGPEAKFRVWLVLDGDVLYVDRNGNRDLTEQGERKQVEGSRQTVGVHTVRRWQIGTITDPQNKANYTDLRVSLWDLDMQLPESARRRIVEGGVGEGFEIDINVPLSNRRLPCSTARWGRSYVAFADRPEDAPIVQFGGPLTMMVDKPPILVAGGIWRIELARIGTPGLGRGSFAALNSDDGLGISSDEPALVELQFTDRQGKSQRTLHKLTYD